MTSSKPQFQWDDPFFLEAQLSDEERMVRDAKGSSIKKAAGLRTIARPRATRCLCPPESWPGLRAKSGSIFSVSETI